MIDLREANTDLLEEVGEVADVETLRYCFACGTCIAVCPASNADPPLLVRDLVRMIVFGLEDELLDCDSPWTCVTCSKCEELCPMDVKPFELGLAVRRWQCKNDETRIPPSTVELYQRGYTQAVDNADEVRASVGLTEKLPTLSTRPEMLEAFRAMLMEIEIVNDNDYMYLG